jgi:outer membrane protein assembly factor BamA
MSISVEALADEMFAMISEYAGKRNLKAGDLTKEMIARHGESVSKDDCKAAIRALIDTGRCVYSYLGGSYIQLPPKEGAEGASGPGA